MKFSSQEEYGLRCLLNIARSEVQGGSKTIQEISRDEGLSAPYVAKLMRLLRLGGFLESARGMEGGYSLSRPANEILVGEVLNTLGGRFYEPDFCQKYPGSEDTCAHTSSCSLKPLWSELQSAIDDVLAEMTIEDLLKNNPHQPPGQQTIVPPPRIVLLQNE